MGLIRVLAPNLVNKIAAGECVERPASVLKELVENSLDAGATRVDIAIEAGGRQLVRITDNGSGMDGDDLALAVQQHATSKLADESDLFALHTLGFRGEALPSIASVSQMRIVTRQASSEHGFAVDIDGGVAGPITPAAAPPGTTVEVRNLFFNTPARRKFLKADSTEISHVGEALARIALSFTEVAFRMTHNGRLAYDLPATADLTQRVADFFGSELGGNLIPVQQQPADDQSPAIRGLIAPPQNSRLTAKWQYIFLNGRYIRDRFIQHALREAYRGLMEPSRQPVVFLYLLMPPELVDFNVHPTKIEVRFADSNRIHSAVLRCLRDRLTRTDLTAAGAEPSSRTTATGIPLASSQHAPGAAPAEQPDEDEQSRQTRIREAMAEFFKQSEPTQRRMVFEPDDRRVSQGSGVGGQGSGVGGQGSGVGGQGSEQEERGNGWNRGGEGESGGGGEDETTPQSGSTLASGLPFGAVGLPLAQTPLDTRNSTLDTASPTSDLRPPTPFPPPHAPVVQIHNTYLVCQTDDGLIIVDQHALHERIIYETLLARLGDPATGQLQSQRMLIPLRVTLGSRQAGLIFEHEELLTRLGLELTRYGRDEVAICAFPSLLERADPAAFLRDLADKLADEPPSSPEEFVHGVLDMMACKAAIKAGDPLTPQEINALLARRHLVERSSNCPHGRPTTLRFSLADLEKQFHRR